MPFNTVSFPLEKTPAHAKSQAVSRSSLTGLSQKQSRGCTSNLAIWTGGFQLLGNLLVPKLEARKDIFALQHLEAWCWIPVCTSFLAVKLYIMMQTSPHDEDFKIQPRHRWASGSQELCLASLLIPQYQWLQQLFRESSQLRRCKLGRRAGKEASHQSRESHQVRY